MRLSERLKWLFAILFVLCGVPLLFFGRDPPDTAAAHTLAGTATLFLGAFALCLAWSALETGVLHLQHFHYTRASQPRRFAASVAMIVIAGCGTITAALWFFFFKS